MGKNHVSEKALQNIDEGSLEQDEELAFIEYQEEVTHSKEEKRNRALLIALSVFIYVFGLGIFALIVQTVYQMNNIAGIICGATLLVAYTICFIVVIAKIFSKHSFDIEMQKRKNGRFSERANNIVRWEMARNIAEQSAVLDYLQKKDKNDVLSKSDAEKIAAFRTLQSLCQKYPDKHIPSNHSQASKDLAEALNVSIRKDGVIYAKAKSIIMKRSLSTGCLTALSQNTAIDASVVVVKNLQLVKDLIWLYGFRPTNSEMSKILGKVVKNVCVSIGLNTMQNGTNIAGKIFNKESNNFLIQMLGQALNMGAQFLGNGAMTYMVGKYTVNALLSQYRIQDIYRLQDLKEYEMEMNNSTIKNLNYEISEEVKLLGHEAPKIPEKIILNELPKEKQPEKKKWYEVVFPFNNRKHNKNKEGND